jgi:hypothetical protein
LPPAFGPGGLPSCAPRAPDPLPPPAGKALAAAQEQAAALQATNEELRAGAQKLEASRYVVASEAAAAVTEQFREALAEQHRRVQALQVSGRAGGRAAGAGAAAALWARLQHSRGCMAGLARLGSTRLGS